MKIKKYRSLNAHRNDIIKTFGLPNPGQKTGEYYRDIADSYRAKLLAEGFDAITFPEGKKYETSKNKANTTIPLMPTTHIPTRIPGQSHPPPILKFLRI